MGQFYTYRRPNNILWFQRIRQRMGFAERRAEGIWARRFGRQSIQRAGRHGLHFFAPQNAATESGNAGRQVCMRKPQDKTCG